MARFRELKHSMRQWLATDFSQKNPLSPEIERELAKNNSAALRLESVIGPLFSCLPEGEETTNRAAFALGYVINRLMQNKESQEFARTVLRRLLWHMNEESGNIGWGIPEALGECLAQNEALAEQYHRILISYILDLDHGSNFCDYAPLRRSCFKAIDRLLAAWPAYLPAARAPLEKAQNDPDEHCREQAIALLKKYYFSDSPASSVSSDKLR